MKEISIQYESRQARECFTLANNSLAFAQNSEEQWLIHHHCTTGIIFAAFSIEAMINHYGRIYDQLWNSKKEGRRKELHKFVFEYANLSTNYCGTKTYQVANECFCIRDVIAHGKTDNEDVILLMEENIPSDKLVQNVISTKPKIYKLINIKNLEKYIDVAIKIQEDIEKNGFYPDKKDMSTGEKRKLNEIPLSMSGIFIW